MKIKIIFLIMFIITTISASIFAESKNFTLKYSVDYSLKHSPYLKYLEASSNLNKGDKLIAKSKLMPFAQLNMSYTKFQKSHAVVLGVEPKKLQFDDDKYFAALNFNYVLWDFKSRRYNFLSEKSAYKSSSENFKREKEKFVYNVIELFLKNLNVDEDILAAKEMLKSVEALFRNVENEVKTGRKPLVDKLKIKVILYKVKDDLSKLNAMKTELYYNLKQLLGINDYEINLIKPEDFLFKNNFNIKEEIVKKAYTTRADLKAVEENLKATELKLKSLKNSYFPEISINSEINQQAGDDKTFKSNSFLGLSLKMPLFDGGYRKGNIEKMKYRLISLTQLKINKRFEIKKDIESAVANYNSAITRIENASASVERAKEVLKIERLKYSLGRSTVNFLLEAEANLLTAKSYYYKALYDKILAYYNIKLSQGTLLPFETK